MPELNPETLENLKKLEAKATQGKWWADLPTALERGCFLKTDSSVSVLPTVADAELSASLRNHAASLIELAGEALGKREAVQIKLPCGFRHFCCKCGGFPECHHKFCPNCGKPLEWI